MQVLDPIDGTKGFVKGNLALYVVCLTNLEMLHWVSFFHFPDIGHYSDFWFLNTMAPVIDFAMEYDTDVFL